MEPAPHIQPLRRSSSPDLPPWIIGLAIMAGLGFVVFVGGLIGFESLQDSSKSYVDATVPIIAANWSQAELSKRESSEFRAITSDEKMAKLFDIFEKLGPMKSYDGSVGTASINAWSQGGMKTTARYVAHLTCENGKGDVIISLIKKNGEWQIYGFRVYSDVFTNYLK